LRSAEIPNFGNEDIERKRKKEGARRRNQGHEPVSDSGVLGNDVDV
jgi:hypothetical protein